MTALSLVLQSSTVLQLGAPVRAEHLRYERPVTVRGGASGVACAVLDTAVFTHSAAADHGDLRLFRQSGGAPEAEVPYLLTESGPEPVADTAAAVSGVAVQGAEVSFDLRMPNRAYTEVKLRLKLKDFVATATVQGRNPTTGARANLGSVAVYDLSARGLGRWTSLLLGESTWPELHVVLQVRTPEGTPRTELTELTDLTDLTADVVQGAEVPPSRLRQTRFVATVETGEIEQRGRFSVALLHVPAHVPVERVAFRFPQGYSANFAREVTVSALAAGAPVTDTEALDAGQITNLSLPSGDPGLVPIRMRENALDATLGATLASPATVLVAVDNAGQPPLPIRQVVLEMRERRVCFFSDRENRYVLRYGDPSLRPPVYDESAIVIPAEPVDAELGPERLNPRYTARHESRPFLQRHPELFWLMFLLCAGSMVGSVLHYVQHRRA